MAHMRPRRPSISSVGSSAPFPEPLVRQPMIQAPSKTEPTVPVVDVERELSKLRRNVESEVVSGLKAKLLSIFKETMMDAFEDPELFSAAQRCRRMPVNGSNMNYVPTVPIPPGSNNGHFELRETASEFEDDEIQSVPSRPSKLFEVTNMDAPELPNCIDTENGNTEGLGAVKVGGNNYEDTDKESEEVIDKPNGLERGDTMLSSPCSPRKSIAARVTLSLITVNDTSRVHKIVTSDYFDYVMSCVLILNSIVIGIRTDWEASNVGKQESAFSAWSWIDRIFCIIFVTELMMRLYTFRLAFYWEDGWQWACFDTTIVVLQIVEEATLLIAGGAAVNLGFLKILKMGRLARMVRMIRLLPELKSLVLLILASMSSFLWTCVLLLLGVYMLSIYLVMMATAALEESNDNIGGHSEQRDLLQEYWGSVGSAVLSCYWSITGGQDWAVVIGPLVGETGNQLHNIVFCMFIAFTTMVLMNLVTGVFVAGAARLDQEDRDKELTRLAHKVFRVADGDGNNEMSRDEFDIHLESGGMDGYLKHVDLDRGAADNLFEILDKDGSKTIDVKEFVEGCLRLRGLPRSADIAQTLLEVRNAHKNQVEQFRQMRDLMSDLQEEVQTLKGKRPQAKKKAVKEEIADLKQEDY